MTTPIKVLLADDHPMFLEGVKNALQKFEALEIVAECANAAEVINYLQRHSVDVAVIDINMPGQNGLDLSRYIAREFTHTKTVLLTMYHPAGLGQDVNFTSFTHGYVLKNSGSDILSKAIIEAAAGHHFIDPKLQDFITDSIELLPSTIKLSRREKEIIRLVMEGKANKEIAAQLFLSELTIKTHRKNIYQKLEVNNTAALMQMVRKQNIQLDH